MELHKMWNDLLKLLNDRKTNGVIILVIVSIIVAAVWPESPIGAYLTEILIALGAVMVGTYKAGIQRTMKETKA